MPRSLFTPGALVLAVLLAVLAVAGLAAAGHSAPLDLSPLALIGVGAIDVGRVAAKWARRAASAGTEYSEGVANPSRSWSAATQAAAPAYAAGVQASIARGAYQKGVQGAGDAAWAAGATQKGPARFAEGVQLAQPAYTTGFGRVAAAINATPLPPRQPTGSPANIQRVAAIATALRKLRTGGA